MRSIAMTANLNAPLHLAARAGNVDIVGLLVDRWPTGQKEKNLDGDTPLHLAATSEAVWRRGLRWKASPRVKKKLQTTWWGAFKMNWYFWPAVQLLNFRAIHSSSEPQHEGHKAAQEIAGDGTVVETHVDCARAPQAERGVSVEKVRIDIHYAISG
jgi:hypothetical protein